ncbi:F-box only protein 21-like isoform X1 [Homalodisca vitripennis]|uniref:F-box only protein 21-like isoform X1 n=1 Tax=Homalodisca vitripennis TaxID=197043 RepID=UPI001EEB28A4|nr:F-box only protein 21-like isoform X1 [Homalodisca vitripennis]
MDCADLVFLPQEIIEQILESKELCVNDVLSFGNTCSISWQLVSSSNKLWKTKFKQMWPQLMVNEAYKRHTVTDWFNEFRERWVIGRKTMQLVGEMSAQYIKFEELSSAEFWKFNDLFNATSHKLSLTFMIDELKLCVNQKNRNTNLTNKYYGMKALTHLRQMEVESKWEKFKDAPIEEQILERGAVIVAQWSQPTVEITDESIGSQLNAIADDVKKQLLSEYGEKHAALCVPHEESLYWRTHNIPDNYYTPYVSRQVIQAVSHVLFKEMGFNGNSEMYYSNENSYINKVLENRRGIPITLSIVFESINRRLGVKCEPVSFPGHFLLRWRDTYKDSLPTQHFYIDVYNGGVFVGKESCPQFGTPELRCPMSDIFRFAPATPLQVVERMANNLEIAGRQRTDMNGRSVRLRSALELILMVNPSNMYCLLQLARLYMQFNMDVSRLQAAFSTITHYEVRDMGHAAYVINTLRGYDDTYRNQNRHEPLEVKRREGSKEAVKFAVGMVMHHRQYDYTCVIIGWDPYCQASEEWMTQMSVQSLSRRNCQPFYHVLVNDGTNRYVAEENLKVEQDHDCWVTHCDVGRYFDTFCHTHYLPNQEMLQSYPDDPPVVRNCLRLE